MNIHLKETLKDVVKYPWHTVYVMSTDTDGITYCVRNSQNVKLLSVNKTSRFDRKKRRMQSEYSMTIYSDPTVTISGATEHVDVEGIFHACETRMANPDKFCPDRGVIVNPVIRFLKQNQK